MYNWSAPADYKMIMIVNSGTASSLTLTLNGYVQSVNQTINAWDLISYDWEEKEIKINNINQRYSWPFEQFKRGMNNLRIQFDWVIEYDLSLIYKEKYL